MEDEVEVLHGGVGNFGQVVRVGDCVLRPTNPHTATLHAVLAHVRAAGFRGVPEVVGLEDDGRERLRFVPGDVAIPPFPMWSQADHALASAVRLLRRFHDATVGFVAPVGATWSDEMLDPSPGADAVLCHNDVCPENVVFRGDEAVALLDFDFAGPGRRVFDVACMARMWVPIETAEDAARTGRVGLDPVRRLRVVAEAYGLDTAERLELVAILADQVEQGGEFVRRRIEAGEPAFVQMWESMGGQERIERRRAWFSGARPRFEAALTAPGA